MASLVNERLQKLGRAERVDHRSYARQGLTVEPGRHYGPGAAYMATRGIDHERLVRYSEAGLRRWMTNRQIRQA